MRDENGTAIDPAFYASRASRPTGRGRRARAVALGLLLCFASVAAPAANANTIVFDQKWAVQPGNGYTYHIPVCLHPNYNPNPGPPWNLSSPYHSAVNNAMTVWNLQGGELFFYRTNISCQNLFEAGTHYVQVGWGNIAGVGRADIYHCGAGCVDRVAIWLSNDELYAFHISNLEGRFHAQSVFTHEFGHAVGLADVNHTSDVMHWSIAVGQVRSALSAHDRAGYTYHYGNSH